MPRHRITTRQTRAIASSATRECSLIPHAETGRKGTTFNWLADGDLLDYGRLPVLTVLLALEVSSTLLARTRLALALLVLWLAVCLGRPTWGRLADLLPIEEEPLSHRFIGGVPVRGGS